MDNVELVYFTYPTCDGNCKHCWSADLMLGRHKEFPWHKKMIKQLSQLGTYSEVKLSGGEPFKNPSVGQIANYIHQCLGAHIPVIIFTSGRPFVSFKNPEVGIKETKEKLNTYFESFNNISLQMSMDEYHIQVLKRMLKNHPDSDDLIKNYITNFMQACFALKAEHPSFLGPQLKIHCRTGRSAYHRSLFTWFPQEWWENNVILTEGLVFAGNARQLENSFRLSASDRVSYFLLPGVDFYETPLTKGAELFTQNGKPVYMDDSDHRGILIKGWWNLIDRNADCRVIEIN